MVPDNIVSITLDNFRDEIKSRNFPALICFWSPWHSKSIEMLEILEFHSDELSKDHVDVFAVNVVEQERLASRFDIQTPCTLVLYHEKTIATNLGEMHKDVLLGWVRRELTAYYRKKAWESDTYQDGLATLYKIITGKTCDKKLALGMSTSAVDKLLQELKELRNARDVLVDLFESSQDFMREASDRSCGPYKRMLNPMEKAETAVKHLSPFKPISGNDVDLIYWCECRNCGSVIAVDHSKEECLLPLSCPVRDCPAHRAFTYLNGKSPIPYPFKYFTKEQIENDVGVKEFISFQRSIGTI